MLVRVSCKHRPQYKDYGGRGITVCDRWREFVNFYADMGDPPAGLTLERKDNDGNYCPENCVWATRKQQYRNQRSNIRVTYKGETRVLSEWAEKLGINYGTVYHRIKNGWEVPLAFEAPVSAHNRHIRSSPSQRPKPRKSCKGSRHFH